MAPCTDMPDGTRLVPAASLHQLVSDIFTALEVPRPDAEIVASVAVGANLRGVDSHGVGRVRLYVGDIQRGTVNPKTEVAVVRDSPSIAVLDGQNGLGQVVGHRAMTMCIQKAQATGCASVAVKGSTHFGIAGYYAMLALEHDMIGLALTNTAPVIVPTNASKLVLGSNPIALAAPADKEHPFVLDMATSVVPLGKIEAMMRSGEALQLGWAVDGKGNPTTDAAEAYWNGGALPAAGPKGYGLALAIEVLTAVLSGASFASQIALWQSGSTEPPNLGHFFSVWRIDAFMPVGEFKSRMDELIRLMHEAPKAEGKDRIYVAGEIEAETAERRRREGIPLPRNVVQNLIEISHELGVDDAVLQSATG